MTTRHGIGSHRNLPWCLALVLLSSTGCPAVLPLHTRSPAAGTLVQAADGQPVSNAEITVESHKEWWPGSRQAEPVGTYVTRTDDKGAWVVPGRARLHFSVGLPEGPPNYVDEYTFRAPTGERLTMELLLNKRKPEETPTTLRVVLDESPRVQAYLLPVVGVVIRGGQGASVHLWAAYLAVRRMAALGIRADVAPGLTALGAGGGIVAHPFGGPIPVPGLEFNFRWLRPWNENDGHRSESGPELVSNLISLRFSVVALGGQLETSLSNRRFLLGVGFGYL